MKTKIVNLFRFNELDTATQALIVNDNIDMFLNDFNFYADNLTDLFVKDLKGAGFYVEQGDINYSGFCSQGDGLSFTCNNINTVDVLAYAEKHGYEKEVKNLKKLVLFDSVAKSVVFEIRRISWRYAHKYTVNLCDNTEEGLLNTIHKAYIADKIFNIIENVRMDLCDHFYGELEQEWKAIQSFEYVKRWFLESDDSLYFQNGQQWVKMEY